MSVTNVYKTVNLSRDNWSAICHALDTRIEFVNERIKADPENAEYWRAEFAKALATKTLVWQ